MNLSTPLWHIRFAAILTEMLHELLPTTSVQVRSQPVEFTQDRGLCAFHVAIHDWQYNGAVLDGCTNGQCACAVTGEGAACWLVQELVSIDILPTYRRERGVGA